jgi:hypothetical protein
LRAQTLYSLYVDLVVRNPFHVAGGPIAVPAFSTRIELAIRSLPIFSSKPVGTARVGEGRTRAGAP